MSGDHLIPSPAQSRVTYMHQVAQGRVQLSFEYVQGWRIHNFSGQSMQMLGHRHSKKWISSSISASLIPKGTLHTFLASHNRRPRHLGKTGVIHFICAVPISQRERKLQKPKPAIGLLEDPQNNEKHHGYKQQFLTLLFFFPRPSISLFSLFLAV